MNTNIDFEEEHDQMPSYLEQNFNYSNAESSQNSELNFYNSQELSQNFNTVINFVSLDQIRTQQMKEYNTLMETKVSTKNIPKTFGNNFKKYCEYIKEKMNNSSTEYELPQGVNDFILKNPNSKQSTYGLEDFRKLCSCDESKSLFYQYITNCQYLDILHSNRVKDPLEYINFIEQYAAGSQAPEQFISSRKFSLIQKKAISKRNPR